jgi:hypothetical protein
MTWRAPVHRLGLDGSGRLRPEGRSTDAVVTFVGDHLQPGTWVVVDEAIGGNWGVAGQALTLDDAKALAAGRS